MTRTSKSAPQDTLAANASPFKVDQIVQNIYTQLDLKKRPISMTDLARRTGHSTAALRKYIALIEYIQHRPPIESYKEGNMHMVAYLPESSASPKLND